MAKLGEHKIIEIEVSEKEVLTFKLQHLGVRNTNKFLEDTSDSNDARISYLLKHVIFTEDNKPITWELFEELDSGFQVLNKVINEAISFLTGIEKSKKLN